ncbi:putative cell wall-binding protein [Clostridium tetanomorphum]|uniref:Cell wall-binding repeat-containing protein n=1 Tax=Clostridium tetanomorphum TaxID=1553 RepID=A0A923EEC1_CLOTT|nr:cell wall-binding repeat-containing protein [Clostridium tetanomorphum]KAJ51056.1 S-layer protein/internalin A-like/N-acetylmuramoyl-L-alanine amidase [Clostridium tetanomorphum DSM 665]MBC2399365.1 cell wall-binding repeat-containing protein [Clostridium tetanomorphum]MBP1865844.1 putative cell wall-binding protein [Clostridium tetanomorphum]NRS85293.1 putative cell wall-binding protein [Clostridium tetanomorphum]NRZ98472.1 putative cell wall-binding protein [Clostridium tetanomorphum]
MKKIISLISATVITLGIFNNVHAKNSYNVNRLYGSDRYKTSVSISNTFENGILQSIIVASGKNFPDALTGSVLSKKLNAPILLSSNIINANEDYIKYINNHLDKNGTIYILGGQSSIDDKFINYMKTQGYKNFVRLGGKDRFDTNKSIVNFMDCKKNTPVVIANAHGFADALSISSIAALNEYPIIITSNSSLSLYAKDMLANIQPSNIYIIGGYSSIENNVVNEIKTLIPSLTNDNIIRLEGKDRYETSLSICKYFNLDTDTAVIANGSKFADALSGSALATKFNAPIILTNGQDITKQQTFMASKNYKNIFLLGGQGSINSSIEYSLKSYQNLSKEEKDFIDSLSNYSSKYIDETTNASLYIENTFGKVFYDYINLDISDSAKVLEAIDTFIKSYADLKPYLNTHKKNLIDLREKVSALNSPSEMDSLKDDYLKSINLYIQGIDRLSNSLDSYENIFILLKNAIISNDIDTINNELEKIDSILEETLDIVEDFSDAENIIMDLQERLIEM